MQKEPFHKIQKIQWTLIAIVGLLVAVVLSLSLFSRNTVTRSRATGGYAAVANVAVTQLDGQSESRFTLESIDHAEMLAFFVNHCEVTVYVGDECVYALTAKKNDAFTTAGGTWVMLPLYESDVGKEVRVVLTALYEHYNISTPEFLLGSEIAIHNATLHRALPALILSLCVIFTGVLLVCLAIYHSVKRLFSGRLYSLGMLAISVGLWRISYDRVAYLLLEDHAVLVYATSTISLMGIALFLLNCLRSDGKGTKAIQMLSCVYCALYIVQLVMQCLGIADLRQNLQLIHVTIVISAVAFGGSSLRERFQLKTEGSNRVSCDWLVSVGVLADLLLYYFSDATFSLVFTLAAILFHSVLEGVQLLFVYAQEEKRLEEMKKDLALSRTTTMMSQIRSHFVFNILNAISGMCKYDPEKADETVVRFARYLRNNIDIMENDASIPFTTELERLEDYVILEQVRFGDRIRFETDIQADRFFIPPLILQPLVENAIKHGLSPKQEGGTITLRTRNAGHAVIITVEDDGVGFDAAAPDRDGAIGLKNIRFRLEYLVHGTLEITSEAGRGTAVTITIPGR